jgi:putative AlgH/UPF0301 family transcriptional regulator
MSLEENGHGSLVRDLLRLHRTFSFRLYQIDVLGFVLAWGLVFSFLAFLWLMSGWAAKADAGNTRLQRTQAAPPSGSLLAGKLLVAHRDLPDPNFEKAVILLMHYEENGAVGVIINRRASVPIERALRDFSGAKGRSDPIYQGGPVARAGARALARANAAPDDSKHVFADVHVITGRAALEKMLASDENTPNKLRIYFGYAGWAPGQLEDEISAGIWHLMPADPGIVFDPDPASVWSRLIRRTEVQVAFSGSVRPAPWHLTPLSRLT